MAKHVNIPIFVPHVGCPNDCVFCNQRSISGKVAFDMSLVDGEIKKALETISRDKSVQIAFFGGSFTGIERETMIGLLECAKGYIDRGLAQSVRLSTRPDYINEEILDILKKYGVRSVELGIQSLDDEVLFATRRGHTAQTAKDAMRLVKSYGFELVGQMMTCLPKSTQQTEIMTAEEICKAGADGCRIYPTVVLEGTRLYDMAKEGLYTAPDLETAVESALCVFKVFRREGVKVLRIGLCSNELLCQEYFGYHPAVGEMVESRYLFDMACCLLQKENIHGGKVTFYVSPRDISKFIGQKKENKIKLARLFGLDNISVKGNAGLEEYQIKLERN